MKRPKKKTPAAAETSAAPGMWAIVELLGHVKIAGLVTEEEHFGAKLGRIDIFRGTEVAFTTQFFGGSSIYRVTPTTEEACRKLMQPAEPIRAWLPPPSRDEDEEFPEPDLDESNEEEFDG